MDEHATALYESVVAAVPGWIERSVGRVLAMTGASPSPELWEAVAAAGVQARAEVAVELRALLEADIDEQRTTPLEVVRAAVAAVTTVLVDAGVPALERDETRRRLFPDDLYDLAPAALADVDPGLAEPGLVWGAHKAMAHLQRHRNPTP